MPVPLSAGPAIAEFIIGRASRDPLAHAGYEKNLGAGMG